MRWTKRGLIYSLENSDDWRASHTQLPIVDTSHGHFWRIYYSSRNDEGRSLPCYIDIEAGNPENIIGQSTQPLLKLGRTGCFDEHGVMPTSIINHDGNKLLYYIGWSVKQSVPYQNAIGLAVSKDNGETYSRYAEGPLISQNHIDPIFTGTFNVLKTNDIWHGYYMSCTEWRAFTDQPGEQPGEQLEPRYLLKYASSRDGIHWQRDGHIAVDYQSEHEGGIVAASTLAQNDSYNMWFCHRKDHDYRNNSNNSYRIGFATSEDAIHWQRNDAVATIDISASGWDSEMICYPCVVQYNNTLYMFYNGNGFGQSGIGYATCVLS